MRGAVVVLLAALVLGAAPGVAGAQLRAGVATVDATYRVGASAGQYASTRADDQDEFDPFIQQYKNAPSYGIQSRLDVRALVVEEGGRRVAIVKNDLYIPQDLLWRRVAQEVESRNLGIDRRNLTIAVTHNHSSPYYASTAWGAWAFQDVFDVRFFTYMAERMADAVERAARALRPVRMGASVAEVPGPQRNALGPALADDGTPAGFPDGYTDHDLAVVRFDDVSGRRPKPYALLVNYSLHPEFLEGNDLISADYLGPLQRMVDRATGATAVFTQNAVGTTEPARGNRPVAQRLEFSHKDYGQAEYGARIIADVVLGRFRAIGRGADGARDVPFTRAGPVAVEDRWFPGPLSHPYPGVSNCRTDEVIAGEPQLPIVGLPDCKSGPDGLDTIADLVGAPKPPRPPGVDPGLSTDELQGAGVPIPENYSAPSYTGLAESVGIHLQAFRLGPILFTVCSCEQWVEQSRNIETRTDRIPDNEYLGYDWSEECRPAPGGTWSCPDPRDASKRLTVSDERYRRMRAQVRNPANGWDDPAYAAQAESEPADPAKIKGNFTHDDTPANARFGYRLTIPIAMANDYNGYIASYREYQRGDHYRKALTAWGPHSSDYLATRLVRLGRLLNGGPPLAPEPLSEKNTADAAFNEGRARALGEMGDRSIPAYERGLPDDGGRAGPVEQPRDVERFGAALFTWIGGSNYTDDPQVVVERRVRRGWDRFADMSGEVPVTVRFPRGEEVPAFESGSFAWRWTAHFEAFVSRYELGDRPRATPIGDYRFVVRGRRRQGGRVVPYEVVSRVFRVEPWRGITAAQVRLKRDRRVEVRVGPRRVVEWAQGGPKVIDELGPIDYPDTYRSPARFVRLRREAIRDPARPGRLEWYCNTCSFRPWADEGNARGVRLTVIRPDGSRVNLKTRKRGGRWISVRPLRRGERAFVPAGGIRDRWKNLNGAPSVTVG